MPFRWRPAVMVSKPPHLHAQSAYQRAVEQLHSQKDQAALTALDEAIRLQPELPAAYRERGQLLERLGLHQRAAEDFAALVRLPPADAEAHTGLGSALARCGQDEP